MESLRPQRRASGELASSFFQSLEYEESGHNRTLTDSFLGQRHERQRMRSLSISKGLEWDTPDTPEECIARTLDCLGLDDPTPSTAVRPRSVSVTYPQTKVPITRTLSAITLLNDPKQHVWEDTEATVSWDEMAHRFEALNPLKKEGPLEADLTPSRSLWIGNMDITMTTEELGILFSQYGEIESVRVLVEKECGFVNYFNVEDAVLARESMQGGKIGSCLVRIGFGKPESILEQGNQATKSLWVGNIAPCMKSADLEATFAQFGSVESCRILTHKNCGFINFINLDDAITAKRELNGRELEGSIVKIGFAKVPSNLVTVDQALSNPVLLSSFASQAIKKLTLESIPELPISKKHDQVRLRDIRKRVDGHCNTKELELVYEEVLAEAVELCSDYIGNVIIQKVVEKCSDSHRLILITAIGPHLASLGIHKNGTWAVQKIIECAKTTTQIDVIVRALQPYTAALLMDQFGNYVIQCCLRLGLARNQFIFDGITQKITLLAQGRFGSRASKACLESQFTSKKQQKQVSLAIVHNAVQLASSSNGSLLIAWLLDSSMLPGRYRILIPYLKTHVASLACHKVATVSLSKISKYEANISISKSRIGC